MLLDPHETHHVKTNEYRYSSELVTFHMSIWLKLLVLQDFNRILCFSAFSYNVVYLFIWPENFFLGQLGMLFALFVYIGS